MPTSTDTEPGVTIPLSSAQERLWIANQIDPGSSAYFVARAAWIRGPLQVGLLRASLAAVMARHEALRTRFPVVDGQPVQVVEVAAIPDFEIAALDDAPAGERQDLALALATAAGKRPFDIAAAPPWRTLVVRVDDHLHLLFINSHHLILDGRSLPTLFEDLSAAYRSGAALIPATTPPAARYADFVAWHREWRGGEENGTQLDYWLRQLQGVEPLALPADRPPPRLPSTRGGRIEVPLPEHYIQALEGSSTDHRQSKFGILIASFAALLHRLTGAEDIPIAIPVDNRRPHELHHLVGMCVNTLVIRTAGVDTLTFAEFTCRVRDQLAEARAHALVPFDKVVRALSRGRAAGFQGLTNVMFDYQNRSVWPVFDAPGLSADFFHLDNGSTIFDLVLSIHMGCAVPACSVRYSTDLFDEETIRRLIGNYLVLLGGIFSDPVRKVADLPLLLPREFALVTAEWNKTAVPFPTDLCLHQLFEAQADRTPDRVAVIHAHGETTYRELNARANRLARHLVAMGAGPEVLVGIFLDRSLDLVVAILAVLKAGSGYVPFDRKMSRERIAYMAADAALRLVVTQGGNLAELPTGLPTAIPAALETTLAPLASEDLGPRAGPTSVAYVIYTSGSTGAPKGVVIEHRSAVNAVLATIARYRDLEVDRTLFQSSVTFDSSVSKILQSICNGGQLVVAPEGTDFEGMLALTERHGIPRLTTTPSELAILNDMPERIPACIRIIGAAGENLSPGDVDRILPRVPILNIYGPTETTISTTSFKLTPGAFTAAGTVPIGKPIQNYQVYIVDRAMNPLPIGCIGEICIGGVGVGRGYLNAPELTAARFVANPFSPGGRLYRSGDLGRWLPSGDIEFRGRNDNQVKIRGYRVELGEIESALGRHAAVQQAVVVARTSPTTGAYLTAYSTLHAGASADPAELTAFLAALLPDYMVPAHLLVLDAFPRQVSGKVDRCRLPVPTVAPPRRRSAASSSTLDAPPPGPSLTLHHQLIEIWQELLGTSSIGITDDFFALGGHSLLAVRMILRIQQVTGCRLAMTVLFAGPTIERLTQALLDPAGGQVRPVIELTPANGQPPLVYLHGDVLGGGYYSVALARHLGGDIPFIALQPMLSGDDGRTLGVADMAARHITQLRSVAPHGPYRLAGFCNSGVVMLEVACQLRAAGETIACLVLIEAQVPSRRLVWLGRLVRFSNLVLRRDHARQIRQLREWYNLIARWQQVRDLPLLGQIRAVWSKAARMSQRAEAAAGGAGGRSTQADPLDAFMWSLAGYRLRHYPGPMTLVVAEHSAYEADEKLRWRPLCASIAYVSVPGKHLEIITTRAAALAAVLRRCCLDVVEPPT